MDWRIGNPGVFYGRGQPILDEREKIKRRTLALRRQMFYFYAN
jgi:hypothetical protein